MYKFDFNYQEAEINDDFFIHQIVSTAFLILNVVSLGRCFKFSKFLVGEQRASL